MTKSKKQAAIEAMGKGSKHLGNLVWTSIHVEGEGIAKADLVRALETHPKRLVGLIPDDASEQHVFGRAVRATQQKLKADGSIVSVERDVRFGRSVLIRVNRGSGKKKATVTYAKAWCEGDCIKDDVDDDARINVDEKKLAQEALDELARQYASHKGLMDHTELGAWLVQALVKHAGAVRVRDEGVLYFVPEEHVEMFGAIRDCLRAAAPRSNAPAIQVMDDDESVASVAAGVSSALEREIADVVDSLKLITSEGKRKQTTLGNRLVELSEIGKRAYACTAVLDVQRDGLVKLLDDARVTIEKELAIGEAAE